MSSAASPLSSTVWVLDLALHTHQSEDIAGKTCVRATLSLVTLWRLCPGLTKEKLKGSMVVMT